MLKKILSLLLLLAGLGWTNVRADVAKAELDTPWVAIGMPRVLHLEVTVPEGARVDWPASIGHDGIQAMDFEDASKHYLLEFGPNTNWTIDTVHEAGMQTLSANLQFQAFDSAAMVIAPFKFVVNGTDTLSTQMLALKADNPFVEVPADPQAIQDLKDVLQPRFVLWDYLWWILIVQAICTVLVVGSLWYYEHRKHRKEKTPEGKAAAIKLLPAHVTALKALEELNDKKLWQAGQYKLFHTELTDILRRYIEERYEVAAMECTTDQILEELRELTMTQKSSYNNLREVLQMADLVKFAKYEPVPDENQLVYMNTRLFIEQTKETTVDPAGEKEEPEPKE